MNPAELQEEQIRLNKENQIYQDRVNRENARIQTEINKSSDTNELE